MVFTGPTSPHVTSIFWNPAAVGVMRGHHIYLAGVGRLDRLSVQRAPIDTATGEPANNTTIPGRRREFDEVVATPMVLTGFAGVVFDLDKITTGIGIYTPFAEELADGPDELRYHTRGGWFYAHYLTLSFSIRATQKVIFGFGFSGVVSSVDLQFDEDEALSTCDGSTLACTEDPQAAERVHVNSSIFEDFAPAIALSLGVMVRPVPRLWLGVAYLSSPRVASSLDNTLDGDVVVDPAPRDGLAQVRGDARIGFRLPSMLHLGARYALVEDRWHLVIGARWVNLSEHRLWDLRLSGRDLRDAGVEEWVTRYRGLQDVTSLDVGVEQPQGETLRVGGRLRLDWNPFADGDTVSPTNVNGPTVELAGGVQYRVSPGWSLSLGGAASAMFPRETTDSAFTPSAQIDCVQSGYDLDACEPAREGRAIPTAAGTYGRLSLSLMLGLSFDRL
jgi:long-subunit fatty acid transport protein